MITAGDSEDRRRALIGLTPQDEANLRKAVAAIGGSVDGIVERSLDQAMGQGESNGVRPGLDALYRIRNAQKNYFRRLLSGDHGPDLAVERGHVARTHETLGIPSLLYLGTYPHFLRGASEAIANAPGLSLAEAAACTASLAKALFLDQVLATEAYMEARLARLEIYRSGRITDLSELISDTARELDAPIAAAINFSEILPQCPREETEGILKAVNDCLKRCHSIVRKLQVFARKEPKTRVAADLNRLVTETLAILEPSLKSNGLSLQTALSPELPPVTADPGQIRQIFTIIVGSAQQAIRAGKGAGSIVVSTRGGDGKVQCIVVDDGPGNQARNLEQAFDPFAGADHPPAGMVFSLHTCRAMLRDHGGDLRVDSVSGAGTTVTLELPARPDDVPRADDSPLRGARVLVLDEKAAVRLFICDVLEQAGAEAMGAAGVSAALGALGNEAFDLLIVGEAAERLATELPKSPGRPPAVVVCAEGTWPADAPRLRRPFTAEELTDAAIRALDARGLPRRPESPVAAESRPAATGAEAPTTRPPSRDRAVPTAVRPRFQDMVGDSAAMQEVFRRLRLASQSDVAVLVTGESGTGKELAARAIHSLSERKDKPFLGVNCSAFPETLLESELFGHVKGAFTGAVRDKVGVFQAAEGGTLFLDEIGDTSPLLQLKLLRVLEEMEIRRVGDDRAVRINVRLVTATHRDLTTMICSGRIREDFYYRIRVFGVHIPPLRERKEDIPVIVDHFMKRMAETSRKNVTAIAGDALDRCVEYPWPGNVRELRNAIEHAFVTVRGDRITLADLPPEIGGWRSSGTKHKTTAILAAPRLVGEGADGADEQERRRILEALQQSGGNKTQAARVLGISRVTLWNRIHRLGIE